MFSPNKMAARKSAKKPSLEGLMDGAIASTGVRVPEMDNEALLRVIALYYVTRYEETPRTKEDLWLFMKQPIPELYKSLFDVMVQNTRNPNTKGYSPLFKRTMSPRSIAQTVEKYLDGKRAPNAKDILVRYFRNALLEIYKK